MSYQLWDLESRNLIEEFEAEADAREVVRAYLTPDDAGVIVDIGLILFGDGDRPLRSIHGTELRAFASGSTDDEARRSG
jgi:hypothetical protein